MMNYRNVPGKVKVNEGFIGSNRLRSGDPLSEETQPQNPPPPLVRKNGIVSLDTFKNTHHLMCDICQKRYSSFSGLNYHKAHFDHTNIPENFDPNKATRRGRPKGYRLNRLINSDEVIGKRPHKKVAKKIDEPPRTPQKIIRKTISREESKLGNQPPRKLTFEESQKLVEIEQYGAFHIVPLDENIETIPEEVPLESFTFLTSKKVEHVPNAEFYEKNEYNNARVSQKRILNENTFFHPFDIFESFDENITEYQMDEEDLSYLDVLKTRHNELNSFTPEHFEKVMDKLEKESEYIVKNTDGSLPLVNEEDVECAVCLDGDCSNNNAIVFCDICNIAVHQDCYGVPFVPEGPWICRRCSHAPSKEMECVLCPLRGGVLKQTIRGSWCHIICAILMPGAFFSNSVFLDAIDISSISHTRFKVACKICNQTKGAVIQCSYNQCTVAFHGSCAQVQGWLTIERVETSATEENTLPQITHRYMPYCSKHLPKDKKPVNSSLNKNISSDLQKSKKSKINFVPATVHVPVVTDETIKRISQDLNIDNSDIFVSFIKRYWQIKRYMRSGVPILKRRSHIPRNVLNSLKLTDIDVSQLLDKSSITSKMNQFQVHLNSLIEILTNCQRREMLKKDKNSLEEAIVLKILDQDIFINELSDGINTYFERRKDFCHVNKEALIPAYKKGVKNMLPVTKKEYDDFVLYLIDVYISQNVTSQKKGNNYRETFKNCLSEILDHKKIIHCKNGVQKSTTTPDKTPSPKSTRSKSQSVSEISMPSPDILMIPSSEQAREYIKSLTNRLKPTITATQTKQYMQKLGPNFLVWAPLNRIKYFPAKVLSVSSPFTLNSVINILYFNKEKTKRTVPFKNLLPLGLCAEHDHKIALEVLNTKNYGQLVKRQVFTSYVKALSCLKGDSSFSILKSKT